MRRMVEGDIDFALDLTNAEQWAYSRNEFERMFRLPHSGCLVWDEGTPSGFVTSVQYGRTAVISHLVVSAEARGKKIGRALMDAALEEIDGSGMETVLLFATSQGERLYTSLGFRHLRDVASYGFRLGPDHIPCACERVLAEDMDEVCSLDESLFGDDRSLLLQELFKENPDLCFKSVTGGRIVGFVFARRTPLGGDVGPWASTTGSRDDASNLLSSALSNFPGERVDMGFFVDVPGAMSLVEGYAMLKRFDVKMMVRGETRYPGGRHGAIGIAGFELG